MFVYLMQQPALMANVRKEIRKEILVPYLESHPEAKNGKVTIDKMLDFENIFNLKYYNNCFMESLRIEPPVQYSSYCCVTEDVTIGGYTLK